MNTRTQSPMEMVHRMSPGGEGQTRSERSFGLYRPVILLLCMFPAAFLAGCGGAGSPPIQNPMPTIASLSPSSAFAGDSGFTLTINGANFVTSSTVQWNGSSRTTTFVSSTALQAAINAADLATASMATVTVSTPAPGGGTSAGVSFTIKAAVPVVTISPSSAIVAAGGQQQFQATVTKTQNTAVTWQVNNITGGSPAVGTISSSGLYIAPIMAANVTVSAVSQADSQQSASANLVVLAPHSIGVRPTATIAEFFDKTTGNAFVPRGNNYIRLATLTLPNGNPFPGHSTFVVGLYDANRAESALATMQTNGYNVARVFLEGCCQNTIGDPAGGLSSAYIANVVDFLQRARTHGIFVITTTSWLPAFGGYGPNCPEYPQFNDINLFKLCPEAVPDSVKFFHDFVQALIQKGAPLDAVFAYELDNEYTYKSSYAPLTWTSGTITTANGKTYDMGSAVSRQQMMDDGLIYFTDQMRAAILALDPTALVTVGFFVPQAPNPTRVGDPRVITVYPAMAMSTADYVSIHPYPIAGDLTFAQYAQNFGFVGYQQQKPVVLEEFGVLESNYPVESTAATVAHDWQVQSCAYGIKGWAFWTWDTSNSEQVDGPFWPASLGAGLISQTLSPAVRPDPCVN
jgi:preprotein translocase subunit Sec61beta